LPLSFESLSHGTIAFGFFNIESDMLLLDRYFFYATEFCDLVHTLADPGRVPGGTVLEWRIKLIENTADIGDLMGAIHGVHFSGFIGEVYRRYPFPEKQEDFKQNPAGVSTQGEITEIIETYAVDTPIQVVTNVDAAEIAIGSYHFDRPEFHRLLDYVWLGGYPRWKEAAPPDYVRAMCESTASSELPLFRDLVFSR
jgi:hypothetical protein